MSHHLNTNNKLSNLTHVWAIDTMTITCQSTRCHNPIDSVKRLTCIKNLVRFIKTACMLQRKLKRFNDFVTVTGTNPILVPVPCVTNPILVPVPCVTNPILVPVPCVTNPILVPVPCVTNPILVPVPCVTNQYNGKRKRSPVTGLEWPRGFQEVKVPRFHDNSTG